MKKVLLVKRKINKIFGKKFKKCYNNYLNLTYDIYYPKYKDKIDKYYNLRYKNIKNNKRKNIIIDMILEHHNNNISFSSYCLYDFYNKNDNERREYLFNKEKDSYLKKVNNIDINTYKNKYETYKKYKDFYKREMLFVNENNYEEFKEFCIKYTKIVKKDFDGSCGDGIKLINTKDLNLKELYDELINIQKEFIIEELVIEDGILNKLHPNSVNTVRITPFIKKDGSIIIDRPFIKVGRDSSFVDNGGKGGILASIDSKTGIVITNGFDESCLEYIYHPNSKLKFKGLKIDHWDELVKLANEISTVDPNARYIGWDFAYTKKGWVVIEGNPTPFYVAQQLTNKKGLKKEFIKLIEE